MNFQITITSFAIAWSLLCLPIFTPLLSQTSNLDTGSGSFVVESIEIQTDRELYITGETVWFKIFVFKDRGESLSTYSKVANFELVDPNNTPISRLKIEIENGCGDGAIILPKNLISHNYTIRIYTQAMRNMGESSYCTKEIIILNPDRPLVRSESQSTPDLLQFNSVLKKTESFDPNSLQIRISQSQQPFLQRSLVNLDVSTINVNGKPTSCELSVAVRLKSPQSFSSSRISQNTAIASSSGSSPTKLIYEVEKDGLILSGQVKDESTQTGKPDITVFLSFPGKTSLVYSSQTNSEGQFSFILPRLYGLRQVILQVRPIEGQSFTITIDEEFDSPLPLTSELFILPPHMLPLANASMANTQISLAYDAFKPPPEYSIQNKFEELPFFGKADASFLLDDYTRFPLPEFFYEIVPEVRVRGTFGKERLVISNEWESPGSHWEPLLLVDGVPVFDQKKFLSINNKLIVSTDIVLDPFWLNPEIFDGIIQITSQEADARSFSLPEASLRQSYLCLLPQQQFTSPEYTESQDSELPDFRNTLYWNPSVQTNEEGQAQISFYTSDAIGEYEVLVKGVSTTNSFGSTSIIVGVVKSVN